MASIDLALPRRRSLAGRIPMPALALPLLVLGAGAFIGALGLFAAVPNTFADEGIYTELGRHFGASGHFEILGVSYPALTYGPAYVALIAPIMRMAVTAREAYMMVRGLNALLFATAAIPTFLIALRAVSRRSALIVAAAAVALPASAYTTKLMTESLAYPVVLWAVLGAVRVVERPTVRRQLVLLLFIVLAPAVRFELLVLGPALALGCVAAGTGGVRGRCRPLAALLIGIVGTLAGALVLLHATSKAGAGAGAHGFDVHEFSIRRFVTMGFGSVGSLDLYSGVLPFAALVLIVVGIRRRAPWISSGLRTVALITVAAGSALLLTSGAYLATVPPEFSPPVPPDRYTFYVVPLLFIAFAAWIEGGAVRERGTVWVAAGAAALPVVAALVAVADDPWGTLNGLAFIPWIGLSGASPILWIAALAAYCCVCAYLLGRGRADGHALIKPVLGVVTVTTVSAFFFVVSSHVYSPPPGWLDAHTRPGVVAVWAGKPAPVRAQGLWEIDVANRNLSAVYFTHSPDSFGLGMERPVKERKDGTLLDRGRPLMARYVLTAAGTRIVGTLVAKNTGFAIYKVQPPVRLDHSVR